MSQLTKVQKKLAARIWASELLYSAQTTLTAEEIGISDEDLEDIICHVLALANRYGVKGHRPGGLPEIIKLVKTL